MATTEIDWKWWSAQRDALDALQSGTNDLVVFRGGYGSGKTILGVRWIIRVALEVGKSDNLVIAPDTKKGGPTTYKAFFNELPGENTVPDEGGDPENSPLISDYNRNDERATFINGSVVRLGSADVWNRYAGGEFNAIYCDEVAHYEHTDLYDLHEMLVTRQRTTGGPNVTLWTSTGNGYNQFYDITELQENPEGDPLPWGETMAVITANSLNNPFLEEREKLKRQFEGTERARQALMGGFAAATGRVYPEFTRDSHVIPNARADELAESAETFIYGYDHGWNDPRVCVQIAATQGRFIVVDEFYQTKAKVSELVDADNGGGWIQHRPEGTVYCEHEPEHIQEFEDAGYTAKSADKDLDDGIPFVREQLDIVDGRPGLVVAERCDETITEFLTYKEDHVGTTKAKDHSMDSIRYALFTHEHSPTTGAWVSA